MEFPKFSEYSATAALAVVVGKSVYGWGKHWWNKKTLRELYINRAAVAQVEMELAPESSLDDLEDEINFSGVGPTPDPRRLVRHKGCFRNYLVRSAQAKYGCPSRNEANRLVVRKYLYDLCTERGLLARHIVEHLDVATELVFIPNKSQLTAAAIRHTELSTLRRGVLDQLNGPAHTIA